MRGRRNAKGQFSKRGGSRRRRRAAAPAAEAPRRRRRRRTYARSNPAPRRRRRRTYAAPRRRRRHYSREKLPGGRVRVRRHRVTMRRRNIPTRGYTRHVHRRRYERGPYTYRPSAEELAAMNPIFAMENPLSGGEVIVTGLMMVLGFGIGSLVDRLLATNTVTAAPAGQGTTTGTLTEAPAAGKVYNTEAVTAPMGLVRWLVGLGVPVVVVGAAHFIGGPWTKVTLQGVGLGWGVRTLGKGLDDLMAYLLGKGAYGARLYADEIRAMNAVKATGTSTLPAITGPANPNAPSVQTLSGIPNLLQRRGVGATRCAKCNAAKGVGRGGCGCDNAAAGGGNGGCGGGQQNQLPAPPAQQVQAPPPAQQVAQPPANQPPANMMAGFPRRSGTLGEPPRRGPFGNNPDQAAA